MFPEGRLFEFLIAATVALIVVGPKDLPILLRKLGQFMARVRSMAAEFRASFDEMARQSELDELRKEVEAMRQGQLADMSTHAPEVNQALDEISQGMADVGVQLHAPYTYGGETTIETTPAPKARKRKPAAKAAGKAAVAAKKPASAKARTSTAKPVAAKAPAKPKAAVMTVAAKKPAKTVAPKPRARKAATK
jgi:sec-independent protein translocase protein TatB